MEEVVVGGKSYLASRVAAERVGYHIDYIGQLCRRRAVPCVKVGRSWFVDERALARHKLETHTRAEGERVVEVRRKDDLSPHRRQLLEAVVQRVHLLERRSTPLFEEERGAPLPALRKREGNRGEEGGGVEKGGEMVVKVRREDLLSMASEGEKGIARSPSAQQMCPRQGVEAITSHFSPRGGDTPREGYSPLTARGWLRALTVWGTLLLVGGGALFSATHLVRAWEYLPAFGEVQTSLNWLWENPLR